MTRHATGATGATGPAGATRAGGTPGTATAAEPAVGALSEMLAAAHAAVFAAAAAGGALAPLGALAELARGLARAAHDDHRALRDALVAAVQAHGATAPAALAAYRLPVDPAGLDGALALLAEIEDRSATAAYDALSVLTGPDRELAVDALVSMTLRGQRARLAGGASAGTVTPALPGR